MTVLIYPSPRSPGIPSGILRGSLGYTLWYTMFRHVIGYRQAVLRRNLHAGNSVAVSCPLGIHWLPRSTYSGSAQGASDLSESKVSPGLGLAGFLQLHVTWSLFLRLHFGWFSVNPLVGLASP